MVAIIQIKTFTESKTIQIENNSIGASVTEIDDSFTGELYYGNQINKRNCPYFLFALI